MTVGDHPVVMEEVQGAEAREEREIAWWMMMYVLNGFDERHCWSTRMTWNVTCHGKDGVEHRSVR